MKVKEAKKIEFNGKEYTVILIDNYYYEVDKNNKLTGKKICYSKDDIVVTDSGELN